MYKRQGTGDNDDAISSAKEDPPIPMGCGEAVPGKCRVSFDMIRLLAGPDGIDAMGRPVGVNLGQDMEAAFLGIAQQVWRWDTVIVASLKVRIGIRGQTKKIFGGAEFLTRSMTLDAL